MKLKTFLAPTIPEAMSSVRQVFGENAVIISSVRTPDNSVRLIVASDNDIQEKPNQSPTDSLSQQRLIYFQSVLETHHLPESFFIRLLNSTVRRSSKTTEEKLLISVLDDIYDFKSVEPAQKNGLYVFIGNSGCGKTTTVVKLAMHAKLNKLKVACVTLDRKKVCGALELARYLGWLDVHCTYLNDISKLNETITVLRLSYDVIFIDTPAYNPYDIKDLNEIKQIKTQVSEANMVYIQQAGMDCTEAQTQGVLFAKAGCTILLGSKLDTARNYGGLLQTALFSSYQWGGWTKSCKVSDYVLKATPEHLSRIVKGILVEKEED